MAQLSGRSGLFRVLHDEECLPDGKLVEGLMVVLLKDFEQLAFLCWSRPGAESVTEAEALALYERNWQLVDQSRLSEKERALIDDLKNRFGNGVLNV